jgi:anti-sigma factor RsiW
MSGKRSQKEARDRELQRFFDGELSPAEARRVYQRIESNDADLMRLASLGEMHDALVDTASAEAEDADFSALWDNVERGIERESEPASALEQSGGPPREPSRFARGLFRWTMVTASAVAVAVLALVFWWPGATGAPSNDCEIESLEVGQGAVSTIFTIDDPEQPDATTVIWVSESQGEIR